MILYAIVSEVSIGALFLAGLLPGLILASVFAVFCIIQGSRRQGQKAPDRQTLSQMIGATKTSMWALLAPPMVMGGIYFGIFTASEAAAVGALYALLVAVGVYRNFGWSDLFTCLHKTMRTSVMVFMIIAGASMFGHAITIIRLPVGITEFVAGVGLGPLGFIIAVMALIFVLGMFLEAIAIILITTPILLPTMIHLGIDPIWYGILLMVNLELAMITPPVGMNLFVIKGITDQPLSEVVKGAAPFVVLMLAGLALSMEVARAYGMLDQTSRTSATVRACYFIDPDQIIQAIIHYPMYVGRSIDELLRVQKALIDTYQNDLSTPANWQPGDKYLKTSLDMEALKSDDWLSTAIVDRVNG